MILSRGRNPGLIGDFSLIRTQMSPRRS